MDEVPLPQRPLLALDQKQRLAEEDEEVLLVRFPVVHPDRLARAEDVQLDPNLGEVGLPFEGKRVPSPRPVAPARLATVQDEPALTGSGEPGVGPLQRRLGNARQRPTSARNSRTSP